MGRRDSIRVEAAEYPDGPKADLIAFLGQIFGQTANGVALRR
jgi:hypothetical protein